MKEPEKAQAGAQAEALAVVAGACRAVAVAEAVVAEGEGEGQEHWVMEQGAQQPMPLPKEEKTRYKTQCLVHRVFQDIRLLDLLTFPMKTAHFQTSYLLALSIQTEYIGVHSYLHSVLYLLSLLHS